MVLTEFDLGTYIIQFWSGLDINFEINQKPFHT